MTSPGPGPISFSFSWVLRRVLLERKGLQTRTECIASADNKLAYHTSRGEWKEFYAAAREIGMEVKALIKLNDTALGQQSDELLDHFYARFPPREASIFLQTVS